MEENGVLYGWPGSGSQIRFVNVPEELSKTLCQKQRTGLAGVWMWGIRANELLSWSTRTSGCKLIEGLGMSGIWVEFLYARRLVCEPNCSGNS